MSEITDEWCAHHFNPVAPELEHQLYDVLARMRATCPVAHTDALTGGVVVARYRDVLEVLQDWRTYSNGTNSPDLPPLPLLPIQLDPPDHTVHRRVTNPYFTPAAIARIEQPTRRQANELIDAFIDAGSCEFMEEFARSFPGLVLFHELLHAPVDEIAAINEMATAAGVPGHPKAAESWAGMTSWVQGFIERRRAEEPRGDVVDAIIQADVDGRPMTDAEMVGTLVLLIMGGLETTAGALGHFIIRFCEQPDIPKLLRTRPELIPQAVEELIRLDVPFLILQRRATEAAEIDGVAVEPGESVMLSLASANRDEGEFDHADDFDLDRPKNRQVAFGIGPHRCIGSNLARMNLRIAVEELLRRLDDIQLQDPSEPIRFHNAFNRAPLALPIAFTARS